MAADANLFDEDDAKCYRGRYYDISGTDKAQDHFKSIGDKQGRKWGCGKSLSNIEAQLYIDTNPSVQQKCGLKGEASWKSARKEYSKVGRFDKQNLFLRDSKSGPNFCAKENEVCQCSGTIHFGYESRPDTGEKISDFDILNDFSLATVEADGDLLSCDIDTFGNDPAEGSKK